VNNPLITELVKTPANAEKVRDQIAAILSMELQNQHRLALESGAEDAADYDIKIFADNSRPYDTATKGLVSVINIALQDITVPKSNPRIGGQKTRAAFEILCIANGNDSGDFRDDMNAAFRAWKIMRLAWRVIMAEPYTYLGMRGIVTHRAFAKLEAGAPGEQGAQAFAAVRAPLEVHLAEGCFGGPPVEFEGYDFSVVVESGQVVAMPSIVERVTGTANPREEGK